MNRSAWPRAPWTRRSNWPAPRSAISRAWLRASAWARSRYSSARVTAWRRSLRARAASANAGATGTGGATRPSRTARIETPSPWRSARSCTVAEHPLGDLGAAGRQHVVDRVPGQSPGQGALGDRRQGRVDRADGEQEGDRVENAVLHDRLRCDHVQVAGQEVVGLGVGRLRQRRRLRVAGTHGQRPRLAGLDPVDQVEAPGQAPVQPGAPGLAQDCAEAADDADLVLLHHRHPVARYASGPRTRRAASRRLMASLPGSLPPPPAARARCGRRSAAATVRSSPGSRAVRKALSADRTSVVRASSAMR